MQERVKLNGVKVVRDSLIFPPARARSEEKNNEQPWNWEKEESQTPKQARRSTCLYRVSNLN